MLQFIIGLQRPFGPILVALLALQGVGCATVEEPEFQAQERIGKKAAAHYNIGVDHLSNGRNASALRELQAAAEVGPTDPWTQLAIAEAYRRMGRVDDSVLHLERALSLNPGLQSARLNLSGVYIQKGDYAKAVAHAQTLVDDPTTPAPWRAYNNLGWAQYRLGEVDAAYRTLRVAVEFHDQYWPALLNLGILENERGRRLEAISLFRRVLELSPGALAQAEANYRIAEGFIALGQQEQAVPHLVAAAESKPGGQWGRKSAEYLELLR